MAWVITKDNICDSPIPGGDSCVGVRAEEQSVTYSMQRVLGIPPEPLPTEGGKVAFRLRDEDMEIHYEGVCDDDPECINQEDLSHFGAVCSGGFICEVWKNGEWVMEVG